MARIPQPLIRLRDETLLQGERVLWQARPDAWAGLVTLSVLWGIGLPWLAVTALAARKGWIDDSTSFFVVLGFVMLAAPVVVYIRDLQTLFVITDRRALILRNEWGRKSAKATMFANMSQLEMLPVRGNVGHLNFASGVRTTNNPDADHTGRYGFRYVKDAAKVHALLDQARRKSSRPFSSPGG